MKKFFSGLMAVAVILGLSASLVVSAGESGTAFKDAVTNQQVDDAKKMVRIGDFSSFEAAAKAGAIATNIRWIPASDFSVKTLSASSAKIPATCHVYDNGKPERRLHCAATDLMKTASNTVMDSIQPSTGAIKVKYEKGSVLGSTAGGGH